jgi:hypothetical protein
MIVFDHGALQQRREPLLAGILAHGVLEMSDAQVITFLAHAERLTVDEWLDILERARELCAQRLPAVRRLRDKVALDAPTDIGMVVPERITAIARTLEQELRGDGREAEVARFARGVLTQLTAASYAIERCKELRAGDLAQLYSPFERCIPITSLG